MTRLRACSTWVPARAAMWPVWIAALVGLAIFMAGFMPASAAAWTPRGLVAAYGLEEGSGSQVADASGYGNGGTIANATWVDSGAYGKALSFNGSDAVVTVDDSASLHLKRAMTLEAWVKPSTVGGDWRDVVYKGNDAYYLEASSQADGLPMGGGSFNGAGGEGQVLGDDWLPTGAWSYLAVTYDGSMLRLYVDGKEVASKPQSGMLVASRDPLQIGGDHIFGQYFDGTIDEVRVYDVALAPDAIQNDMLTPVVASTSGDPEPPSAPGGLAASTVGPGEVDLSWTAASDNVGVTGYDVFRCQGAGCSDFTQLATLGSVTGYQDTSVAPATSYTYRVRAFDAAGNLGPYSDPASATTAAAPDTQPPTKPASLVATASGSDTIGLGWDAATDDRGVSGYQVERCSGQGCSDFTHLADTTGTTYSDSGLKASTEYTYRVRASDAAGNLGPYSDPASATTAASPPAGVGPLRVGPTGRYLVDQNGTPFLITGESPQAMIGDLTEADAAAFFAKRASQGFNTVWINLLCNSYTGCNADGTTWDGVQPFTTPGDLSTPNEAYFAHVDRVLQLAQQYGFVVLLDPIETGGWLGTMVANGVTKDRDFGRYLGARYKGFTNIIWMSGNDYQQWGPTYDPYVTAVAQGIADNDPNHLQTVELNFNSSGSLDDPAWAPLIQLDAAYTYDPTYKQVLTEYDRPSPLPTFMVEATYEFEQNTSSVPYGSPLQLRKQEYWSLLSGAAGQMYGNHYTWQFLCPNRDGAGNCVGGWKDQLDSTGATQMAYVTGLFAPRKWYELVPDQTHSVVTDGLGTFGADDYVTAASTADGALAMAYVPSSRTITVDLSKLSGIVTARWYDPTNGTFTSIAGSPFPNAASVQLATPGTNAAGDGDWVLVLEASAS